MWKKDSYFLYSFIKSIRSAGKNNQQIDDLTHLYLSIIVSISATYLFVYVHVHLSTSQSTYLSLWEAS